MAEADPRTMLDRLIRERGEDYAGLSRLIGRNAAYVQQYIKRGTPKRLSEDDRRLLARYFGISEEVLGGPAAIGPVATGFATVPRLDLGASAGPGALVGEERALAPMAFDPRWLRGVGVRDPSRLSIIRVSGDSMVPTLSDGDEILVDRSDAGEHVRDGIYVLRIDEALMVKRVAVSPGGRRLSVRSDNPVYPKWPDCDPATVELVGRVVWAGRRIA